jgi:hypothetical protein
LFSTPCPSKQGFGRSNLVENGRVVLFSKVEDFGEKVGGGSGMSEGVDMGSLLEMSECLAPLYVSLIIGTLL